VGYGGQSGTWISFSSSCSVFPRIWFQCCSIFNHVTNMLIMLIFLAKNTSTGVPSAASKDAGLELYTEN
jgi:hypothetical protein